MVLNDTHCKRDDNNSFTATIKLICSQFIQLVSHSTSGSRQTASTHWRKEGTILWCWPSTARYHTYLKWSKWNEDHRGYSSTLHKYLNLEIIPHMETHSPLFAFLWEKDAQYNYCSKLPFRAQARPVSIWWSLCVRGWIKLPAELPVNPCSTRHQRRWTSHGFSPETCSSSSCTDTFNLR